jgi:PIN domain nuclease of toxin-antitoxin system
VLVLDTHAFIWWVAESRKLSSRARREIRGAREIGVPGVCCWETAMLVSAGRLKLDRDIRDWVRDALGLPKVKWIDLSPDIAVTAGLIARSFHGDPLDRLIVATALELRAPLVTADHRLAGWPGLEIVW